MDMYRYMQWQIYSLRFICKHLPRCERWNILLKRLSEVKLEDTLSERTKKKWIQTKPVG